MSQLPLRRITLYKHGLGCFERRGAWSGDALTLSFPRRAMDDVLKSLVALDLAGGQILGLSFETPPDRNAGMHRAELAIDPRHSLVEMLAALRGRQLSAHLDDGSVVSGAVLGVELEPEQPLERARLLLCEAGSMGVRILGLRQLVRLAVDDEVTRADLEHLLRAARSDEEREQTVLKLSPGEHRLQLSYIAPAPAWRVSYRVLVEIDPEAAEPNQRRILLQAWGLFDNTLDEDLVEVELSLVAGMPVSFRYLLHAPKTPERRVVEDEERTVDAPVHFDAMMAGSAVPAAAAPSGNRNKRSRAPQALMEAREEYGIDNLQQAVTAVASGEDRGALFAYRVATPVSVGRGQSAMVPLLSQTLSARQTLLYNPAKLARHPVAGLQLRNSTGLTLERGPVTVLDQAEYGGEAVLPFTPVDAELILAYAVELGVHISERSEFQTRTFALRVRDGGLFYSEWQYRTTHYELRSALPRATEVTIEHARQPGFELAPENSGAPESVDSALARWRVPLAARARAGLEVHERCLREHREEITTLDDERLQRHFQARHLDADSFERLRAALALTREIQALREQLDALNSSRDALYKRQKQVRENLAALKDSGPEAQLRARLVAEINALEDQLAALERREQALNLDAESRMQALAAALEAAAS